MSVANIYIESVGSETVMMDFSPGVRELTNPERTFGFGFLKTLEHLGLEASSEDSSRLTVTGSLEVARSNSINLRNHIGLIARYGAAKETTYSDYNQDRLGRILGTIAQSTLVELPDNTDLPTLSFSLAYPFGKAVKEDGVYGHLGLCKAPWRATLAEIEHQRRRNKITGRWWECIPLAQTENGVRY